MPRINLICRDSHLKGDWWEWMCQKVMEDGRLIDGYVQADGTGDMIAEETFESNEEE
jgi:hypothetical protein